MSNSHLFLKPVFLTTPGQNGIGRYVCQLQRVVLKFCMSHGSSRGVREFIETRLMEFVKESPEVAVYLKPRRHRSPVIKAEYLNGEVQWVNARQFTEEEVLKWLKLLKSQSTNRTGIRLRKLMHTDNPSIQGPWTPYLFRDPQLNLALYPNVELSKALPLPRTATQQLVEMFQKQKNILRCAQRDQGFVQDLQSQLHSFLKHLNPRRYHEIRRSVPLLANLWYYYLTSVHNLQTLGEEYTGTVRINCQRHNPTKLHQFLWLLLHIGGEPLALRALLHAESSVSNSPSLTQPAKDVLLKGIKCFKDHAKDLKRIHQSLFYMDGNYYHVANRVAGVKYVLLRDWLQNASFSGSFKLLGKLSLFYTLFTGVQAILTGHFNGSEKPVVSIPSQSVKYCIVCAENIRSATATPCGHVFCWECLWDSLDYQHACPVCREEVLSNRIIFLQNYV